MDRIIQQGTRTGYVTPPASKSQAHRQLICAALSNRDCEIFCDGISKDIEATISCLQSLGAEIERKETSVFVHPVRVEKKEEAAQLMCSESGSTLRFLIPVTGALGKTAVFHMEGKLPERPLEPFATQLKEHGMTIEKEGALLICSGQLEAGTFTIPGNISSQFVSGLLMALPILPADSEILVTGKIESEDYIKMTEHALQTAGIKFDKEELADMQSEEKTADGEVSCGCRYRIFGGQTFSYPPSLYTERDWSGATFFCCMGAFSENGITVKGMAEDSLQGDRAVTKVLQQFGADVAFHKEANGLSTVTVRKNKLNGFVIDAAKIPDMVPALSAVAAVAKGQTRIIHAERLRMKESDRLKTVSDMLSALGADIRETEDGLVINGKENLLSGTVDAAGDHRIAMAAAVASCICTGEVNVQGSECVSKSYPSFWEDMDALTKER